MPKALDPSVEALVAEFNSSPLDPIVFSPDSLRAASSRTLAKWQVGPAPELCGTVRADSLVLDDRSVPIRRYAPLDVVHEGSVVVHLHGGGWIAGSLDSADRFARDLAIHLAVNVVSVGYRLSDEAPFPAALLDAVAVVKALRSDGASWIGLSGDSAGGNLAASTSISLVRSGEPVDAQLLIYPCLDPSMTSPSYKEFADGFLLTAEAMGYYWRTYAAGHRADDELLAPLAATSLVGMPSTVIATAESDPLVDEGAEFARRLIQAGVRTTYLPAKGLVHAYIDFTDRSSRALAARDEVLDAFAELHRAQVDVR
ncbi:MAG: Alpha/beta hydrolase fold-3 domain protein [Marmoricola sp.]|nr:Alpha/beta hydrolase fold-3 domain protein [Marmoricola sp.]